MRKSKLRKGLVVAVIVLFVGASVVPSTGMVEISNNGRDILYVGGSGPGNYSKIQDAIDNASSGDTVFVYDDSSPYYECIDIDKSISLIGENRNTTIIDGNNSSSIIDINAGGVTISGFIIQNAKYYGIRWKYHDYNNISNNIIKNSKYGISFTAGSNYNDIFSNVIYNVKCGISLPESASGGNCDYNNFVGNTIDCNNISESIGISFDDDCDYNKIINNTITNVTFAGIFILGWYGTSCDNNYFDGNTIYCSYVGIYIHKSCNNQILRNNSFFHSNIMVTWGDQNIDSSNTVNGRPIYYYKHSKNINIPSDAGQVILLNCSSFVISNCNLNDGTHGIVLMNSNNNTITNNTVNDSKHWAIHLWSSSGNNISYNIIDHTKGPAAATLGDGIYLYDKSNSNKIFGNTICNIQSYGINVPSHPSYQNHIYHNNFINNSAHAVDNGNNTWDKGYPSGGNHWDDYTGEDSDGDGIGDTPYDIPGDGNQDEYPLMTLYGPPHADFVYVIDGFNVSFNASLSYDYDGYIETYSWEFGDGSNGAGKIINHSYSNNGYYTVNLTVTDDDGEQDNESKTVLSNEPPYKPSDPEPENGSTDVDINADLSWTCSDPDGDNLTYNVYFEANDPTPDELVSENQTGTTYNPGVMDYNTHYYWQIVAWDEYGASTSGPIWDFTTGSEPNDPPYPPSDPDPENGSIDVDIDADLSWTGGDPDENDTVVYDVYLEANDPTPDIKVADDISETTFDPGTLDYETVYYWRIIAKDNHGASTWGPVWHFTTEEAIPDLNCGGSLSWTDISPGSTVTGNFYVENIGDPTSLLDWEIESYPDWGTWTITPEEGYDLTPELEPSVVEVSVEAPDKKNSEFTGEVKIVNSENTSDYCTIDVSLATPRNKAFNFNSPLLSWLFERFPNVFPLLRQLLDI